MQEKEPKTGELYYGPDEEGNKSWLELILDYIKEKKEQQKPRLQAMT